jgi:multiple sugar transport system ATP-binding protein
MASVLLENIKKVYDNGFVAVQDVYLDVADKEFMVIVGPSGCGKTTTLRMIAGLEDVTEGTITIAGRVVNDVEPKDRDIAMVFQNFSLYPHMTVSQNMAFALKLRKIPKKEIKQRVQETAKLLGIEDQLNKKPKALSGGQRQRVALGRAIVRNPVMFLFDEPLSNLDAKLRLATRAELKTIVHRLQTTTIYVTHDQQEAMTLGDRICVMYDGVIQQVAPPMEVYEKPVNRFVAGFLGSPPMNFFDGTIVIDSDRCSFVTGAGSIELPVNIAGNIAGNAAAYVGAKMVLGIRPEHISTEPCVTGDANSMMARVEVVEPLGDRTDVYFQSKQGVRFVANIDPHVKLKADDSVKIYLNAAKAHIFHPGETGLNISI